MADTNMYPVVDIGLGEPLLDRFELFPALTPLPDSGERDKMGVKPNFPAAGITPGVVAADCPPTEHTGLDAAAASRWATTTFAGFSMWNAAKCSMLSFDPADDDLGELAQDLLRRFKSRIFAEQLFTGAASNGTGLNASATVVANVATGLGGAIAAVQGALADAYGAIQGLIHIPRQEFDALVTIVDPWPTTTARGHRIVSDTGYTTATMQRSGSTAGSYVYMTGPIYFSLTGPNLVGSPEQAQLEASNAMRDVIERLALGYGVVAYHPSLTFCSKI